jgi:hypothetical protein
LEYSPNERTQAFINYDIKWIIAKIKILFVNCDIRLCKSRLKASFANIGLPQANSEFAILSRGPDEEMRRLGGR